MAQNELKDRVLAWCSGTDDLEVVQEQDDSAAELALVLRVGRPEPVRVGIFKSTSADRLVVLHTLKLPPGLLDGSEPGEAGYAGSGLGQAEREAFADTLSRVIEGRLATLNATTRPAPDGHEVTINSWVYLDGLSKHTFMTAVEEVVRVRRIVDRLQQDVRPDQATPSQIELPPAVAASAAPYREAAPEAVVPVADVPAAGSLGAEVPYQTASELAQTGPAPGAYEPSPGGYETLPGGYQPAPGGYEPAPAGYEPAPAGHEPAPAGYDAAPAIPDASPDPASPSPVEPISANPPAQGWAAPQPGPQTQAGVEPQAPAQPQSLPQRAQPETQGQPQYPRPQGQPQQFQAAGWPPSQPAPNQWTPTHSVPPSGMDAWALPDPTQPTVARLDPGVPVQVVESKGAWAHIVCSNSWSGWVDYRILVQVPR